MRYRNLLVCTTAFTAALFTAMPAFAQAPAAAGAAAKKVDNTDPRTARFGVWDNSTNPNNVMTYEAFEKGGSKLTVSNPSNPSQDWSYVTMFDGKFMPVTGQPGSETAVEIITLSEDNNTISNEYIRMDKEGKITGVTHVIYNRRKK
jgi:outer membrane lipoprotein-sorting protein